MPLLSKTLIKINRLIPRDAKQLTIENIRNAFRTLVTDYNAQILSRKRHSNKLLSAEKLINSQSSLPEILITLDQLRDALERDKSSFALKALQPILTALQLNPIQQKTSGSDEKILREPETLLEEKSDHSPTSAPPTAPVLSSPALSESDSDSKRQQAAAILIQKRFRTFNAQKKYKITHLKPTEQESYQALVVGNDPVIDKLDKYKQEHDDKHTIAVVGTSVLRSIEIGLELSNSSKLPKIIIIDNSKEVTALWDKLRAFSTTYPNKSDFFKFLPRFLSDNIDLYRDLKEEEAPKGARAPSQDIMVYLQGLSKKYGFANLVKAITATTVIKQNWQNRSTFQKLKASLDQLGISKIYVYPSNIVSYVDDDGDKRAILENISLLDPQLIIHTDDEKGYPEKVFLLEDSKPDTALTTLPKPMPDPFSLRSSSPSTTSSGLGGLPPGVTLIRFSPGTTSSSPPSPSPFFPFHP